jgi:hypothetical protein
MKAAVAKLMNATWQRCQVHTMRNALAHAGKSGRRVVSAFMPPPAPTIAPRRPRRRDLAGAERRMGGPARPAT